MSKNRNFLINSSFTAFTLKLRTTICLIRYFFIKFLTKFNFKGLSYKATQQ